MNIPPYTIELELVDGLYVIVISDDCRSAHLPYDDFLDWADTWLPKKFNHLRIKADQGGDLVLSWDVFVEFCFWMIDQIIDNSDARWRPNFDAIEDLMTIVSVRRGPYVAPEIDSIEWRRQQYNADGGRLASTTSSRSVRCPLAGQIRRSRRHQLQTSYSSETSVPPGPFVPSLHCRSRDSLFATRSDKTREIFPKVPISIKDRGQLSPCRVDH
jgi:hypothetical protein